jgi:arsenate reductase
VTVTIYHDPDCATSRNVLALIRNSGEEPRVIEYLRICTRNNPVHYVGPDT